MRQADPDGPSSSSPGHRPSPAARLLLAVACCVSGLAYRASVTFVPAGVAEDIFLAALASAFLVVALMMRRRRLEGYSEIAIAFFIFTVSGLAGDISVSPLQKWVIQDLLHEVPTTSNPLASSLQGTVLVQVISTLCLVLPILVLTRAFGGTLRSIFVSGSRGWVGLVVSIVVFVAFYFIAAFGLANRFFPNRGVSFSHYLSLAPALLVLVLLNGLREEMWFRGLFLAKYGRFLRPFSSNLLAAVIFTSFHVQVSYSRSLPIFLVVALIEGLILGYLMQRSRSVIAPAILHAGTDIPIFLVYLSSVSS